MEILYRIWYNAKKGDINMSMENKEEFMENEKNTNENQIPSMAIGIETETIEEEKPLKKKKTKIILFAMCASLLVACSLLLYFKLNENVFKVEKMINNMGEITLDSKKDIQKIEKLYNELSESEKKRVKNKKVLDKNKEIYTGLLLDSFESSSVYKQMKKIVESSMFMYNPEMNFDKKEKTLTINLSVSSDIEDLLLYYPMLAKPAWNQVVENLNALGKSCYDLVKEYEIDVVLQMYPQSSSYRKLFESLNGETKFDVLD